MGNSNEETAPPARPIDGRSEAADATTMPLAAPAPANVAPHKIGDYEIVREIARGGMGVVFQAIQVSAKREVALKVILTGQLAAQADVERFHAEAEAAAHLDHPNIVPIYDVGESNGQPYFSMKLIDGGSLAGFAGAPRAAAEVVAKAARAVHYAHQRGVIHRDLKPGNILVDSAGQPFVTDFGLAKRVESDSNLTRSGAIMGTPSYMPPEQASGKRAAVTTLADVYSLGAVLYQLLAGRPPFRGDTPLDTVLAVLENSPAPPSQFIPSLDRDLEAVCLKCLQKAPSDRYASAAELASDLERWLRGEPTLARPPSAWAAARFWLQRNLRSALWVVAIGILLGMGVGFASYLRLLEPALRQGVQSGYGMLPNTPRPLLTELPFVRGQAAYAVGLAALLMILGAGLAIVLLVRPTTVGMDVSLGLATGFVAAFVATIFGGAWTFAGLQLQRAFYGYGDNANSVVFKHDLFGRMEVAAGDLKSTIAEENDRVRQWNVALERKYPDLVGMSPDRKRALLYDKLACDAVVAVQIGLLKALPLLFTVVILIPVIETATAGYLSRQSLGRRQLVGAYFESMAPLALILVHLVAIVWYALEVRAMLPGAWFGLFVRQVWPVTAATALASLALVAVWRQAPWWWRAVLHAIALSAIIYARVRFSETGG